MAQHDDGEEVKGKGSGIGTRTVVIIACATLLLNVVIILGVLLYLRSDHGAAKGAEGEAKGAQAKKVAPTVYPLEPFIVNIHDNADVRYLKIKIEFETTVGPEAKAQLDPYLPTLRDAILVLLTTKSLQDIQDLPGKNRLREEIFATATKIVPPGKISRVLFTDFVVQ